MSTHLIREFTGAYSFLSNFSPSPVVLDDGLSYPTAEHAFQAQKTGNITERMAIRRCRTARDAKAAGRKVALIDDWDSTRTRVMSDVVMAKFWQNPELARALTATGNAVLVEGNYWHDNFWGSCWCERPACAEPGLNYLGQILVWARAVLRED
jgi:ribA/ribD-fused uncharacterized protein